MTTAAPALALVGLLGSAALAQPVNDDCVNATTVSPLPLGDVVDLSAATNDGDASAGAFACAAGDHSVWYRVTAGPDDVLLGIDAFEGSPDTNTVIEIYAGTCGALGSAIGVRGGADENGTARVPAGTSVMVCVRGWSEPAGIVQVQVFEVPEFLVGGPAYDAEFHRAGVAGNDDGHFLVAWGQWDGASSSELRSQLFARDGTELSAEFVLAPWGRDWPYVEVAGAGTNDFVVTWDDASDVLVQRIDGTGTPQGTPFAANQAAPSDFYHDVAGVDDRFVVVWDDGPFARLFDASGTALTDEFQVSTGASVRQYATRVAMAPDGRFVVTWYQFPDDTILVRRFDATGDPQGAEIVVAADDVTEPDVAMAPNGDFVVVWEDYNYYGPLPDTDRAIAARAYASDGTPKGPAVQVNQIEHDRQHRVRIEATGGDFVVAWENDGSRLDQGYGYIDMAARRVDTNAQPLGPEFLVNTVNRGYWQILPNVGAATDGSFVVTYTDRYGDEFFGVDDAVMARGFAPHAFKQCPGVAATTCRATVDPGKSKLLVRHDGADPNDLAINWKWVKGAATSAAEFGDPSTTDGVYFCLYSDEGGGAGNVLVTQAKLPAGGLCGAKPCWKALGAPPGAKGFKYKDGERSPNGVLKAVLKPGDAGRSKVVFKAGRANLALGVAGGPPAIPVTGTLTAQLHQPTSGTCWGATFPAATAKRNGGGIFQGSSD